MAKVIRLIELTLENYTSHRSLTVTYGDITRLSGPNGAGKSSIGGAPVWVLYGTDLWGKRWSPKPTTYEADVTRAALIIEVDGKQYKFERGLEGGDIVYVLNDVPVKAKEYEAEVAALFDKDEFMVSYYPAYFFGLHWTKQRELVLRNTTPPPKSEVFAEMSRTSPEQKVKDIKLNPAAAKLDELTKKHSLDELDAIHRKEKTRLEKAHIAAQSKTKTLQEQLDIEVRTVDIDSVKTEISNLDKEIEQVSEVLEVGRSKNNERISISSRINLLTELIEKGKKQYADESAKEISVHCSTCGQPLTDEAKSKAEESKVLLLRDIALRVNPLIAERKELLQKVKEIDVFNDTELQEKKSRLQEKRTMLNSSIRDIERRRQLADQVEQAKADETATLTSLKESIFILDAIKAYRAKEAEMMAEKVQSLFTTLSIRLFKLIKSTGELEPDFSIQMDGKDYLQLSTGERMTAELELTDVLFKQSEMVAPLFFDNRESFTGKLATFGQTIIARAAEGEGLTVEVEDAA